MITVPLSHRANLLLADELFLEPNFRFAFERQSASGNIGMQASECIQLEACPRLVR